MFFYIPIVFLHTSARRMPAEWLTDRPTSTKIKVGNVNVLMYFFQLRLGPTAEGGEKDTVLNTLFSFSIPFFSQKEPLIIFPSQYFFSRIMP